MYHSLRRESIKNTTSQRDWGQIDSTHLVGGYRNLQEQPEPMHGLKLVIKEEALPLKEQPEFPALAELAKRGLLAPDTWSYLHCWNAVWPYECSSTKGTGMSASRTPESQ